MQTTTIGLFEILELVGIIFSAVLFLLALLNYFKNTRIRHAESISNLFSNFQRDRQAILDNPMARKILAAERGQTEEDLVKSSMASFAINRAYMLFFYHRKKLISKDRWENDVQDMKVLFTGQQIIQQWDKIKSRFTYEFQQFVETKILR